MSRAVKPKGTLPLLKKKGQMHVYLLRHLMKNIGLSRDEAETRLIEMMKVSGKLQGAQRVRERKAEMRQQRTSSIAKISFGSRPVPGGATGLKQQR